MQISVFIHGNYFFYLSKSSSLQHTCHPYVCVRAQTNDALEKEKLRKYILQNIDDVLKSDKVSLEQACEFKHEIEDSILKIFLK